MLLRSFQTCLKAERDHKSSQLQKNHVTFFRNYDTCHSVDGGLRSTSVWHIPASQGCVTLGEAFIITECFPATSSFSPTNNFVWSMFTRRSPECVMRMLFPFQPLFLFLVVLFSQTNFRCYLSEHFDKKESSHNPNYQEL